MDFSIINVGDKPLLLLERVYILNFEFFAQFPQKIRIFVLALSTNNNYLTEVLLQHVPFLRSLETPQLELCNVV